MEDALDKLDRLSFVSATGSGVSNQVLQSHGCEIRLFDWGFELHNASKSDIEIHTQRLSNGKSYSTKMGPGWVFQYGTGENFKLKAEWKDGAFTVMYTLPERFETRR